VRSAAGEILLIALLMSVAAVCSAGETDELELELLEPEAFDLGGDLKLLALGQDLSELGLSSAEWHTAGSVRLKLDGQPQPWLAYEVHARVVQEVYSDPLLAGLGATEPTTPLFRGLGGPTTWRETGTSRLWGGIDYANLRLTWGDTDLVLGRQAVTFGRSFFWNPIDWLSAFSPLEIDREYKGGVDVARLSHALGRFSGLEAVYAYGEGGSRDSSALFARAYATWHDWDVELLAGSVWIDNRIGAAFSGEIGGAGVRGELSWQDPRVCCEDPFLRATLEVDYRWPSSLQLMGEYHYNGFGSTDPADYTALLASDRVTTGQLSNVGRSYGAVRLSYELTPLLVGSTAVLLNLHDGSGLFFPELTYSLADEASLVAGAAIGWGEGRDGATLGSELGAYPTSLWVQWRWSF